MEANSIYFFDIRTRQHEKVDIEPLLKHKFINNIKDIYATIGLSITVINDAELFIKAHYKYKGYKVLKCRATNTKDCDIFGSDPEDYKDKDIIIKFIEQNFKFYERNNGEPLYNYLNKYGLPDFLVYRKEHPKMIHELFFVEVKNWDDGIKGNQILWMFSNNIPVKIAYLK